MLQHEKSLASPVSPTRGSYVKKGSYSRYAAKGSAKSPQTPTTPPPAVANSESSAGELDVYLEERYGRNLPQAAATSAKRTLRRRIAGVLVHDSPDAILDGSKDLGPSSRGIANVSEDDVFLYPTGMAAIWNAHQLALAVRPSAKSICFGYVQQCHTKLHY
jgi:cystathionine gamma-synthase